MKNIKINFFGFKFLRNWEILKIILKDIELFNIVNMFLRINMPIVKFVRDSKITNRTGKSIIIIICNNIS